MDHAKTIAMAEDLLAAGRTEDVVRMVDPLLDVVDAPAADTGQLLLRALRARVEVVEHRNPSRAVDFLPDRSEVDALCSCVQAEVSLWRGWAYALRHREPTDLPRALRLLQEAQDLQESIHDPSGRTWALLGTALAYFSLDEFTLLQRALDAAAPLLDSLDDTVGRRWLYELSIPALRAAGRFADAAQRVEALRSLGTQEGNLRMQGVADSYEALLLHDRRRPVSAVVEAAESAESLLRRLDRPAASPLFRAYQSHIAARLRHGNWDLAREASKRAARDLHDVPTGEASVQLLRAQVALETDPDRAKTTLEPLLGAALPFPRGVSRAEVYRLYGTVLSRQGQADAAATWLDRAHRHARETGASVEARRTRLSMAHTSVGTLEPRRKPADQEREASPPGRPVSLDGIVAESEAMQSVLDRLRRAHPTRLPLLLRGEGGTGKCTLARAVHAHSARADGPLEHVTAAGMQQHPTENRLFGSVDETGSLTCGAVHHADGGTLLIEDIDALSLSAQSSLLHLLHTGEVAPAGGAETTPVDVRLVATTTEDLAERVRNGHFRPGLRDRLSMLSVEVPPLRERRADLPLLVRRFLDELQPDDTAPVAVTHPAMEALLRYDWPGNVRQLRNELERVLVHVGSEPTPTIDIDLLLDTIVEEARANGPTSPRANPDAILHPSETLRDVLSRTEKDVIERVLRVCDGQVTASADVLGLTRQGLYKKMKRLGIDASSFQPSSDATPAAS